jgi:hypothetical protein
MYVGVTATNLDVDMETWNCAKSSVAKGNNDLFIIFDFIIF